MELVDADGKPLKSKSKGEVIDILKTLRPKNREQEKILAMAIGLKVEENRKSKITKGLKTGFDGTFVENTKRRQENSGYSKGRTMRLIANIPREMAYVARQVWGDDVFTNKEKFKEEFVKDELGRYCLTVKPEGV
jgi:hypothetical protein